MHVCVCVCNYIILVTFLLEFLFFYFVISIKKIDSILYYSKPKKGLYNPLSMHVYFLWEESNKKWLKKGKDKKKESHRPSTIIRLSSVFDYIWKILNLNRFFSIFAHNRILRETKICLWFRVLIIVSGR